MERDCPGFSHFLRRSPEKLQEGDFKRLQFRIRQNWIAKFVGRAVCVQVKTTKAFFFFPFLTSCLKMYFRHPIFQSIIDYKK